MSDNKRQKYRCVVYEKDTGKEIDWIYFEDLDDEFYSRLDKYILNMNVDVRIQLVV